MPRRISTRLIVENIAQYKRDMYDVSQSLRSVSSNVDLVRSKWDGQRNTLQALVEEYDALVKKQDVLKSKLESQRADVQKNTELQQRYAEALENAQKNLNDYLEAHPTEDSQDKETVEKLRKEVDLLSEAYRKTTNTINTHTAELNKTEIAYNKVSAEVRDTGRYVEEAKASWDGTAASIDETGTRLDATAQALRHMAEVMVSSGLKKSIEEVYELLRDCVDAAVEFESAITGVSKTTDFTGSELSDFATELQNLAARIPIATTELAAIAETAGQLGIADDSIIKFTEVMANLGVSTTMSAEEAATALAQLASITGMSSDSYDRLGSTIVALGNNFATTESRISDMSKNIAAAAVNADMSETDILALSAAVTSLGVEAGYGGTAISKLLQEMQAAVVTGEGLEEWAAAAGMSAREFARLWGEDAASAVLAFISNMGTLGEQMTPTLQTLGITESRITRVIQSLANAEAQTGTLSSTLNIANTAWAENNALTIEAEKRYATVESKTVLLSNAYKRLKVSVGNDLLPIIGLATKGAGELFNGIAQLNEEVPILSVAIPILATELLVINSAMALNTNTAKALFKTVLDLGKQTLALPLTKTALLIAGVVTAVAVLTSTLNAANKEHKEYIKSLEKERDAIEESIAASESETKSYVAQANALASLIEQEERSAADKAVIRNLVNELNASVPNLNVAYDEQTNKLYSLATGAEVAKESIIALAEAEADSEYKDELTSGLTTLLAQRASIETEIALLEQKQAEILARNGTTSQGDLRGAEWRAWRDAEAAIGDYEHQLKKLNPEIEHYKELIGYVEAEEDAASATRSLINDVADLTEEYEKNRDAAAAALASQIGLFEEMETKVKSSYNSITEALQSQLDWQNNYREAVNNLMARDIDGMGELIDKITEVYGIGSQEAYDYIVGLSKLSDEEIGDVMEMLGEVEDGQKDLASTLGEAKTVVNDEMQEILAALDATEQARLLGQSVGEAYITALRAALSGDVSYSGLVKPSAKNPNMQYHAQGLDYVPYDDYLARLHEGEMVLNRAEARAYRAAETASSTITNATTVNIYPQNLSNAQIDYIYRKFNAKLGGAVS